VKCLSPSTYDIYLNLLRIQRQVLNRCNPIISQAFDSLTNNNEDKADEKRVRENNRRMFDRLIDFDSSGTKHAEKLSDLQSLLEQTQDRLSDALSERYQYNTS